MTAEEKLEAARNLAHHRYVKRITANGAIWLKAEFRNKLYQAWLLKQSVSTIEKMMAEVGLGKDVTGKLGKSAGLHKSFKERFQREQREQRELQKEKYDAYLPQVEQSAQPMQPAGEASETADESTNQNHNVANSEPMGETEHIDSTEHKNDETVSETAKPHRPKRPRQRFRPGSSGSDGNSEHFGKTEAELVQEGILIKTARGYKLAPAFIELCEESYPDKFPVEILSELGINPRDVKPYRLKPLMEKLRPGNNMTNINAITSFLQTSSDNDDEKIEVSRADLREWLRSEIKSEVKKITKSFLPKQAEPATSTADVTTDAGDKKKRPRPKSLAPHPYVVRDAAGNDRLSEAFYNDAKELLDLLSYYDINCIIKCFELNTEEHPWLDSEEIFSVLQDWQLTKAQLNDETILADKIRANQLLLLEKAAVQSFDRMKIQFKKLPTDARKEICLWISQLPEYPGRGYNTRDLLSKYGISKSIYYRYVNDKKYGMRIADRLEEDTRIVRAAFDYKGYAKGVRQVCMLIPRLNPNKKMSYNKVSDIMKKAGLDCGIRKPKNPEGNSFMEKNKKPNFLRREFRKYRPNQVRVTDVTQLFEKDGVKYYGSAIMDPVTGRIIAFNVSDANDLCLVLETLILSDKHPCNQGKFYLFHSDQATLYHLDGYQDELKIRKFVQSMSREGCCYDNAVIESFFGHFKDECSYSHCNNLKELQKVIDDYVYYYNNERGRWHRNEMTPIEYEEYLLNMTQDEWDEYMRLEIEAYETMSRNAAEKAMERAKRLQVEAREIDELRDELR